MKDIEIVLENLVSHGIKPDKAQKIFLETFIDRQQYLGSSQVLAASTSGGLLVGVRPYYFNL
jgi:deoxyribodipyrimidine photolyase-like uncharacterized protein